MIQKLSTVSGQVPTVAPSDNHVDGSWDSLDVYIGELFMNSADGKMWCRTSNGIKEIFIVPSTVANGDTFYLNASGGITRLPIGTSGQVLSVSSGNVPNWVDSAPNTLVTRTISKQLSLSEMQNIGTTPVLVVPAPGVGRHLLYVAGSAKVTSGTTNYNETITFLVTVGVDPVDVVGGKLDITVGGSVNQMLPQTGGTDADTIQDNVGLYIQSAGGDLTGGNKLYTITIYYGII